MPRPILVSPSSFGQCGGDPLALLERRGFTPVLNPTGRKLTEDEVIALGQGCLGIVAGVEPLTRRVMDALPELRCISRVGVGLDNVDLACAREKGIAVCSTPDGPTQSVAELTLGLVLALLRRIPAADANLHRGTWKKETGRLLQGKRVGVVGLGRIGKQVASMFLALGNPVTACDISPDEAWRAGRALEMDGLEGLCRASDIVTLHTPPPRGGRPLLGERELGWLKPTALLVNVARGGVVDEEALLRSLREKRLAGAALDVFSQEPYSGPLCRLDNVVLTPHIGSYAEESKRQMEVDAVVHLLAEMERAGLP